MENSPAWEMLFTGLLGVWFIGYVVFRIARGFYRWAMGRPTAETHLDEDELFPDKMDFDWTDKQTGLIDINPYSGLQMISPTRDSGGNLYGTDSND